MMKYLFGHSGLLLDILLLHGGQRPETSLHLKDGGSEAQKSEWDSTNKKKDKNSIKLLNHHMQGVLKASANTLMPPRVRGYRHQGRKL